MGFGGGFVTRDMMLDALRCAGLSPRFADEDAFPRLVVTLEPGKVYVHVPTESRNGGRMGIWLRFVGAVEADVGEG